MFKVSRNRLSFYTWATLGLYFTMQVLCVCVLCVAGASVVLSHTSESYNVKTGKTFFGIPLYHSTNPKTVIQVGVVSFIMHRYYTASVTRLVEREAT